MAGTSVNESLGIRHCVFCVSPAPGQSDGPVHLLVVALDERDVVSVDEEIRNNQFSRGGLLDRVLRLAEAVQEELLTARLSYPKTTSG